MASALLSYWIAGSCRRTTTTGSSRRSGSPGLGSSPARARPEDQALAATLLGEGARLWGMSGRAPVAFGWAQDAMHLADASGDAAAKVTAMAGLAIAIVFSGRAGPDGTDVRPLFEGGADLAEEIGDWWLLALAAGFAGASLGSFDPDGGEALMQRGIAAARRSGSPYTIGAVSMAQGRMLGRQGKTDAAVAAFGVAIERFMELGDERFVLASRSDMAHACDAAGGSQRRLPSTARPSPAGSTSATRERSRTSWRTSRISIWSAGGPSARFACWAPRMRSERLPMPGWRSTRNPSTSRPWIGCVQR